MKTKIGIILLAVCFGLTGLVIASTVSTQDGQNFSVTNDSGFSTNMTLNQIVQKFNQSSLIAKNDSIKYLAEQETADVWGQVLQMANTAYTNWQSLQQINSDNSDNTTVNESPAPIQGS